MFLRSEHFGQSIYIWTNFYNKLPHHNYKHIFEDMLDMPCIKASKQPSLLLIGSVTYSTLYCYSCCESLLLLDKFNL